MAGGVERLGVHRGGAGQLFHLPLAQPHPGGPLDRLPGIRERPARRRLHRRQPPQSCRVPAHRQVQNRIGRMQIPRRRCRRRCFRRCAHGRAGALRHQPRRRPGQRARGGRTDSAGTGSNARNGPIGLASHRDRPKHGGQPAPVTALHPRPRHAIASGHRAATLLQPGTLIQMPLQQQPILLPRVDLKPGFQFTVPGTHRLRPIQPPHHRLQIPPDRAGPPRPAARVIGGVAGRAVDRADTAGADRGR
jgi:hypothetical protein